MDLVERVARKRCERHIRNVRRHDTAPEELERNLPASVDYAWRDFEADTREDIAEVLDEVSRHLSAVQYDPAPYTAMKYRLAQFRKESGL